MTDDQTLTRTLHDLARHQAIVKELDELKKIWQGLPNAHQFALKQELLSLSEGKLLEHPELVEAGKTIGCGCGWKPDLLKVYGGRALGTHQQYELHLKGKGVRQL